MEKTAFLEVIGLVPSFNVKSGEVSLSSEADKRLKEMSVHQVSENLQRGNLMSKKELCKGEDRKSEIIYPPSAPDYSRNADIPSPTSSNDASLSFVLKDDQSSANDNTKTKRKRKNSAVEDESTNKRQKKEIQSDHKCPACDKIYARRDTLHTHMEKVHRMSSRDIKQHQEKQRRLKHVHKMAENGTPYSEEYITIYLGRV